MSPGSGTDSLSPSRRPKQPGFNAEEELLSAGAKFVAGVDEAGRGPLAGPVVAAAVMLDVRRLPQGINDSKKLTKERREDIFEQIIANGHVAWACQGAQAVDRLNIRQATLTAMTLAVCGLPVAADAILIDGRDVPTGLAGPKHQARAIIGGDGISLSIAAASIVAKVVRDRLMARACETFPGYGFSAHSGYGTAQHLDALRTLGPCPLHRRSFAPVRETLAAG